MDLGAAFSNFVRDCERPRKYRRFHDPEVRKKALNDSFALWDDQFDITGEQVRIASLASCRCAKNSGSSARSWVPPCRFAASISAAGRWRRLHREITKTMRDRAGPHEPRLRRSPSLRYDQVGRLFREHDGRQIRIGAGYTRPSTVERLPAGAAAPT